MNAEITLELKIITESPKDYIEHLPSTMGELTRTKLDVHCDFNTLTSLTTVYQGFIDLSLLEKLFKVKEESDLSEKFIRLKSLKEIDLSEVL